MQLAENHPYWHLKSVVDREPNVKNLTLSYYFYRKQSLIDERTLIHISRDMFLDFNYMEQLIFNCPLNQDLAIHSLVECQDELNRHIPMADMSTGSKAHLKKLKAFFDEETFYEFVWFDSGRSFHGYGSRLVSHEQWIKYMGQLLLSNQKDLKPTVDPRWIGHRLIAGYSALRWTCNTDNYIHLPTRIIS